MHGFCTLFAHRRESRVFPCIVCILCIVAELVGARPLHLAGARPFCYLKAPLGLSLLHCARKREFSILFQANSRRVNSRRGSGFICWTTFSIPSGVIWMLSGRFSFTGTRKSCLEHMWVADMEFAVAPEVVDSSPPKSPFSLHRKQDHASD